MAYGRPGSAWRALIVLGACGAALVRVATLGCATPPIEDDTTLPIPQRVDSDAADGAPAETPDTSIPPIPDAGLPDVSSPCDALAPFTDIVPINGLSTPIDESVVQLRQDESLAFVTRGSDVAVYQRQPNGTWDGGAGLQINTGNGDNARLTDDLLTAHYNVFLGGTITATRLVSATRSTTSSPFGGGNRLELGALTGETDTEPFALPDLQTIYFTSTRGGTRLLYSTKRAGNSWAPPVVVPGSLAGDRRAVVTSDERVIYFASDRVGGAKLNVFMGVRTDNASPFQISEVTALSTSNDEYPTWLSPDLCRLYFSSDRAGGPGQRDVWLASRAP